MFLIGNIANIYVAEGSASAGTGAVVVSAPWKTAQIIVSNDSSGRNMDFSPMGVSANNKIMTIAGGESLSMYYRTDWVRLSAGTDGIGYRVWMLA